MLPPEANDVGRWIERSALQPDHRVCMSISCIQRYVAITPSSLVHAIHGQVLRVVSCQASLSLSCLQKHPSLCLHFPNPTQRGSCGDGQCWPAAGPPEFASEYHASSGWQTASRPSSVSSWPRGLPVIVLPQPSYAAVVERPLRWRERVRKVEPTVWSLAFSP